MAGDPTNWWWGGSVLVRVRWLLVGTLNWWWGFYHLVVATPTSSVTSSVLVKPLILTEYEFDSQQGGNFMPGGVDSSSLMGSSNSSDGGSASVLAARSWRLR